MGWKGGGKAGPEGSLTVGAGPQDSLHQVTLLPQPPVGSPPGRQLRGWEPAPQTVSFAECPRLGLKKGGTEPAWPLLPAQEPLPLPALLGLPIMEQEEGLPHLPTFLLRPWGGAGKEPSWARMTHLISKLSRGPGTPAPPRLSRGDL